MRSLRMFRREHANTARTELAGYQVEFSLKKKKAA
jgi:hypothetical protein